MSWSYHGLAQRLGSKIKTLDDNIIFCLKCEWVSTLKHVSQVHRARNAEVVKFAKVMAPDHVAMKAGF